MLKRTFDWLLKQTNKGSYTPTNIWLNLWTVMCLNALMSRRCRLRHLSLCASRTTAVSEKISDCQALPNLSAKLPNISPLFSWWKLNDHTRLLYLREPTHAVVLSLTAVSRTAHHYNIGMNRHRYYESPTIAYNFRTTFKVGSDYNILIISSDAQTCMARYVLEAGKWRKRVENKYDDFQHIRLIRQFGG